MSGAIVLDTVDLLVGTSLVVAAGVLSIVLQLGIAKRLGIAALRTVVQLLLVGYVLRQVFELSEWWAVIGVALVMIGLAAREAVRRPERTYRGVGLRAFLTLVLAGLVTTVTVTSAVVGAEPWYAPQYLIPLLGMTLGNGLTGVSLCLDTLLDEFDRGAPRIELELAMGATRSEACREPLQKAVRRGLIPIVNSMSVAGLVSLPGMMTGQILAGADPVEAVKYQIVVMFMISAGTALGCFGVAWLSARALFDDAHRLRRERIAKH